MAHAEGAGIVARERRKDQDMGWGFLGNWSFWGVVFDIAGASFLLWGELAGEMAMIRYQATGDFERYFESEVKKRIFWKRWMLRTAKRLGSDYPSDMNLSQNCFSSMAIDASCTKPRKLAA
jgi:hypothetical protein